jgi:hypothetical protein
MRKTDPAEIIIGIDTHKEAHAAVAINGLGARLGAMTLLASRRGYHEMESWAQSLGPVRAFGIEGTGSYGAGLTRLCAPSTETPPITAARRRPGALPSKAQTSGMP